MLHYLEWGAAERRAPNPLFSVPEYLAQTDAPAAKSNPLLHFVLEGERAGLRPHRAFQPQAVRTTFRNARDASPLATYLGVIGMDQPSRAARLATAQAEPAILPGSLPRSPRTPGEA